jgi:hypothetical protein
VLWQLGHRGAKCFSEEGIAGQECEAWWGRGEVLGRVGEV